METIQIAYPNVSGVILAAGKASRMGRDKLSLPFRGRPMLQHVVDAARGSCLRHVSVVIPQGSTLPGVVDMTGCRVVEAAHAVRGQAESLKAGLRSVMEQKGGAPQGCMVLLGDQPLLTTATIDILLGAFAQQQNTWIAPVQEDMRGNPVIIPASWFDKVFTLQGDTGASPLLASPGLALRLLRIHEVGPFIDVDTEQEYQRLINKYEVKTA